MAKYSKAQLAKNRRTVAGLGAGGAILVGALAGASVISLFGGLVVVGAVAGCMWWLFASKGASTIDNSWVDGFSEGGAFWYGIVPYVRKSSSSAVAKPQDELLCSDCGLGFGASGGAAHVGCKTE